MTQYKMPGDHVISVNHNFGAITDYFPICDNPNGVSEWKYNAHPVMTWYREYLYRREVEMHRAIQAAPHSHEGAKEIRRLWDYIDHLRKMRENDEKARPLVYVNDDGEEV